MAALAMTGCATASAPELPLLTTASASGLNADEMAWNCGRLENAIDVKIAHIVELQKSAKSEADQMAPTFEKLFGRWTLGNTPTTNTALANQNKERSQADAYNARLPQVGCAPIDIDGRIAAAMPK